MRTVRAPNHYLRALPFRMDSKCCHTIKNITTTFLRMFWRQKYKNWRQTRNQIKKGTRTRSFDWLRQKVQLSFLNLYHKMGHYSRLRMQQFNTCKKTSFKSQGRRAGQYLQGDNYLKCMLSKVPLTLSHVEKNNSDAMQLESFDLEVYSSQSRIWNFDIMIDLGLVF